MSKFKKLIISLILVLSMMVAMAVGIGVFAPKTKTEPGAPEVERDYFAKYRQAEVTYSFEEPVEVKEGTPTIDYSYAPSDDTKAGGAVAYEYVFNNPNQHVVGVDLQRIEAEGINISYAYLDDLDDTFDITSGTSPYKMPTIQPGGVCRIFIILSPDTSEIPADFTTDIYWNYGKPGKTTFVAGESELEVDIIKGAPLDPDLIPTAPDNHYFDGWTTEENSSKIIGKNFTNQGGTLYARYANLPVEWLQQNGDECWVVRNDAYPLTSSELVIPSYYQGLPVTRIVDGDINAGLQGDFSSLVFGMQTGLTSINLPETMQYIGAGAFVFCASLTNVILPDSIHTINPGAFAYCLGLQTIKLPKNLTSISALMFAECPSLTYVDASYSNITAITDEFMGQEVGGPFIISGEYGNSHLESINLTGCNNLTNIGDYAFWNCEKLINITIPTSVTNIGENAFYQCRTLNKIVIPSSVTSIGSDAFVRCTNLNSVEFNDNSQLTSIGEDAFYHCENLAIIDFGNDSKLTSIEEYAFSYCDNLISVNFGDNSQITDLADYTFYNCKKLTTIDFGDNSKLSTIGDGVFWDCIKLTTVDFGANSILSTMGTNVFYNCNSLTNITIPNSLTSMGLYVFYKCNNLTSINIPNTLTSIEEGTFTGCTKLTNIDIPNSVTSIGKSAFVNCINLTNLDFGANSQLDTIGENAFARCTKLTNVKFDSNSQLTSIGKQSFYYCTNLNSIVIPASVTDIQLYAFWGCENLTSIKFSNNNLLTTIGENAFRGCTKLTNIDFGDNSKLSDIGDGVFWDCSNLAGVDFGYNSILKSIGVNAFFNCSKLNNIIIPNSVTNMGMYSFYNCSSLTNIDIPNNLISIEEGTFNLCNKLTTITIPKSVTKVHSKFAVKSGLSEITFEDYEYYWYGDDGYERYTLVPNINTIFSDGYYKGISILEVFNKNIIKGYLQKDVIEGTSGLLYRYVDKYYELIGKQADAGNYIKIHSIYNDGVNGEWPVKSMTPEFETIFCRSVIIPNTMTNTTSFWFGENIISMVVVNGNPVYDSRDNCNAVIETATNTLIAGCQNTVIPNTVTSIGMGAFDNCYSLTSIVIPAGVTSIGSSAFSDCYSLTSITIPEGVTSIGDYAFDNCYSLTSITIPESVTSIGNKAFAGCSSLTTIVVESGNQKYDSRGNCNAIIETSTNTLISGCSVTVIPASVTSIGDYAFSGCMNLTSIDIPASVTSIGHSAFYSCSSLTSVDFGANSALTSIGGMAFYSCTSLTSVDFGANSALTSIGELAFDFCTSLSSIIIPASVTSIGFSAFSGCSSLTSITILATTPPTLGGGAIPSNVTTIYIPKGSLSAYQSATSWSSFSTKFVEMD